MKLSSYVLALRPWSFSASLVPVLLGCALAHKSTGECSLATLLVTLLTALSVHGAGNLVNTYYDYVKGIDSQKGSEDRTLVDHILSQDEVVTLGATLYGVGCAGFIVLAAISPARMEHLALVYFGGLSSSFLYTGGIGLKYIALGDVLILIIFGPVTLLFSFLAQTGCFDWGAMYYAVPLALNTEAILHSNNTRDMDSDARAGIVTLAILVGDTASHVLYAFLLFSPYTALAVLALHHSYWFLFPLLTLPSAFRLEKQFRCARVKDIPKRTAKLNIYFGLLFVLACVLTRRERLPFLTLQGT